MIRHGDRHHDGHEPAAAEEAEIRRQLDGVVPVEQHRGDQADHDAGEHAVVDLRLRAGLSRATPSSTTGDIALKTASITRYPAAAASAVEPSAFLAKPMATPIANSSGRLANIAPPAALIASKNGPITGVVIPPSRSGWPSRSRMPAAGSSAIGSIRLLPSRCNCANPGMRSPDFFFVFVTVALLICDYLRFRWPRTCAVATSGILVLRLVSERVG